MTYSAFDHPYLSGLLGDEAVAAEFSVVADVRAMLAFEAALARAEARHGVIPEAAANRIAEACRGFSPDVGAMRRATAIDGVVVPELVRQLRRAVGEEAAEHVHFGASSQDVVDTSLMLRLKAIAELFSGRIGDVVTALEACGRHWGERTLTAHTRMQPAIPITVADRLRSWIEPLFDHQDRLDATGTDIFTVQFGGAAGTLEKLKGKADIVRATLAEELALVDCPQWHSQRLPIADFAHLLSLVTGSLGKFGQDVALMAQAGDEIVLAGGGGSSAMPHKQNPVAAEVLVTLARFNATQISAIHQSLVHEQERSGSAWTLEWLILPQMVGATAAALRLAAELAGNVRRLGRV
ncbi:3-carboxy-cis,cis-muconate cycloisomerase [Sinorhizobium meliloti]|jgi:3-carboxy-cis,cis-muconate cycloisomerase|uniref:3-carboxy-cis,cis-muconate cycloisomerase n=1 Tax=Rhizobium meliloti TaxID=382 RepID=A0A2J0Z5M7_RHIML|nr:MULTISPECIES: 3-carboxy-cis,cis-muconate cycloisomerase [Sinorhizobium]PJR15810.1 3-carboxy-cis,cis-muconate cycloisomerase [Sinorhizobium meliloti]PND27334.1 3-carboxy-cis,cis-muconate cycloisomerase [Sinorhizobium sp. M4_45]GCA51000.1 3-carboxy-cis,cis-muconate cycloisomerase [Sinorhizobium sp. KGO-5]